MIFNAVLCLLEKIPLILEQSYKDPPAVSTGLVKYLSMNTSIEVVDDFVSQRQGFKTCIVESTKSVTSVRKDGGAVGNKADKLTNEVNEVKERLTKVEQKK